MDSKESYTHKEVEEIISTIEDYNKSCRGYHSVSKWIADPEGDIYKEAIKEAKEKVDKSIEICKKKIPKNLLDKIELLNSEQLKKKFYLR